MECAHIPIYVCVYIYIYIYRNIKQTKQSTLTKQRKRQPAPRLPAHPRAGGPSRGGLQVGRLVAVEPRLD